MSTNITTKQPINSFSQSAAEEEEEEEDDNLHE